MAVISAYLATGSLLLLILGPSGSHFGLIDPVLGFRCFQIGLFLGVGAAFVGISGLRHAASSSERAGRAIAWLGPIVGSCVVILILALVVTRGFQQTRFEIEWKTFGYQVGYHPLRFSLEKFRFFSPVKMVSTNRYDPPLFSAAPSGPDAYSKQSARLQSVVYPGVRPLYVTFEPQEALEVGLRIAEEMGWQIYEVRREEVAFEAYAVSPVFRFIDDVSVRFRPSLRCVLPAHSRCQSTAVDLQSRSRQGYTDSGANAERICEFRDRMWVAQGLERTPTWRGCRGVGSFATGAFDEGDPEPERFADDRGQEELCVATRGKAATIEYTNTCNHCVHLELGVTSDEGVAEAKKFEIPPYATHSFDVSTYPSVRIPTVTRCNTEGETR